MRSESTSSAKHGGGSSGTSRIDCIAAVVGVVSFLATAEAGHFRERAGGGRRQRQRHSSSGWTSGSSSSSSGAVRSVVPLLGAAGADEQQVEAGGAGLRQVKGQVSERAARAQGAEGSEGVAGAQGAGQVPARAERALAAEAAPVVLALAARKPVLLRVKKEALAAHALAERGEEVARRQLRCLVQVQELALLALAAQLAQPVLADHRLLSARVPVLALLAVRAIPARVRAHPERRVHALLPLALLPLHRRVAHEAQRLKLARLVTKSFYLLAFFFLLPNVAFCSCNVFFVLRTT